MYTGGALMIPTKRPLARKSEVKDAGSKFTGPDDTDHFTGHRSPVTGAGSLGVAQSSID